MHIRSVVVKNYRVHQNLTVTFDRRLSLIGGPNEAGKSTLAEAIHRGLFLKSKVTGDALTPMRSNLGDGHPEVEVEFQIHNEIYRVYKKFSGTSGVTRLSQVNGKTVTGDEAETRLSELLGVEAVGGGRGIGERVSQQWAHLWVWQGQSGTDPSTYATAQRDALLARLQSGSAIVMQSELDARVAAVFINKVAAEFSAKREPKVRSPLFEARKKRDEAQDAVHKAEENCLKLDQAVQDFSTAGQAQQDAEARIWQLQQDLRTVELHLEQVRQLRLDIDNAKIQHRKFRERKDQLLKFGQDIERAESELRTIRQELKSAASTEGDLVKAEQDSERAYSQAQEDYEAAQDAENIAIGKLELATAVQEHLRVSEQRQSCEKDQQQANEIRQQLADVKTRLAVVPVISETQLRHLQKSSKTLDAAEATLKAIATGIELVVADQSVRVGSAELRAGQPITITESTEISIGDGTRLLIRPGGGTGVAAAETAFRDAERDLRNQLVSLGVQTLADAETYFNQQLILIGQRKDLQKELSLLNADTLSERVLQLQSDLQRLTADIDRRKALLNLDIHLPQTVGEIAEFRTKFQQEREQAKINVQSLKRQRELAAAARENAGKNRNEFGSNLKELEGNQRSAEGKLLGLIQLAGDGDSRIAETEKLKQSEADVLEKLATLERDLETLEPYQLEQKKERFGRSLETSQKADREAGEVRAAARAHLQNQGVFDPQEQLATARARLAESTERCQNEERQARASLLLADLFQAEQKKHSASMTQPLVTKIADYVRPIFGRAIDVQLSNDAPAFSGLALNRRDNQQGIIEFDKLSAGAREQLAAAVRLAIAELLAEGSDGCLPIVFDDAFAYSDPDRVESLQAMLDLAASRGLQIIVLTCSPRDYFRLGATEVTLTARSTSSAAAPESTQHRPAAVVSGVSEPNR
jgi:DNA repair exonuclease SbcCD ATPase subunit